MPAVYYSWGNQHSSMVFSALCLSLSVYLPTTVTLSMIGRVPTTDFPCFTFFCYQMPSLTCRSASTISVTPCTIPRSIKIIQKVHRPSRNLCIGPCMPFTTKAVGICFCGLELGTQHLTKNRTQGAVCVIILVFPARNLQIT